MVASILSNIFHKYNLIYNFIIIIKNIYILYKIIPLMLCVRGFHFPSSSHSLAEWCFCCCLLLLWSESMSTTMFSLSTSYYSSSRLFFSPFSSRNPLRFLTRPRPRRTPHSRTRRFLAGFLFFPLALFSFSRILT